MKVSELAKGMLIECVNENEEFVVSTWHQQDLPWLAVRLKTRASKLRRVNSPTKVDKFFMYLGTKSDLEVDLAWCNKFGMIGGQMVGIDPTAWPKLRQLK